VLSQFPNSPFIVPAQHFLGELAELEKAGS